MFLWDNRFFMYHVHIGTENCPSPITTYRNSYCISVQGNFADRIRVNRNNPDRIRVKIEVGYIVCNTNLPGVKIS